MARRIRLAAGNFRARCVTADRRGCYKSRALAGQAAAGTDRRVDSTRSRLTSRRCRGRRAPDLGQPNGGLRAAVEFRRHTGRGRGAKAQPIDASGIPLGTKLDPVLHVQNVSDKTVEFVSETWRQDDAVTVKDEAGIEHKLTGAWYSGMPIMVRWTLKPGEIAELRSANIGIAADEASAKKFDHPVGKTYIAQPGKHLFRVEMHFACAAATRVKSIPAGGDFAGDLVTGETPLVVRARTPADDEAEKQPTFTGRVQFIAPDEKSVDAGTFEALDQSNYKSLVKGMIQAGGNEIPLCPEGPLTLKVRAAGFEEAVAYDVNPKPGAPASVRLTPAKPTRFRLVSSADGSPVAGANIRFFNKTSGKASAGPYPMDGIKGPIWATSDATAGSSSIPRRASIPITPNSATRCTTYIDPTARPLFLGPVRAGHDLRHKVGATSGEWRRHAES